MRRLENNANTTVELLPLIQNIIFCYARASNGSNDTPIARYR